MCTHNIPNSIQIIGQEYQFQLEKHVEWKVKIIDDERVEAMKVGENTTFDGEWNILYDQSLFVQLKNG